MPQTPKSSVRVPDCGKGVRVERFSCGDFGICRRGLEECKVEVLLELAFAGRCSNQGEKSIDLYFIVVPLRNRSNKQVFKYGTPEPSLYTFPA